MTQLNFDARSVAPATGFEAIPAGWYKAVIDESEMKPTKSGTGAYLECRFNIIDGPYQGRKVFARLNLRNDNAQAQEIGFRQLSAIAHAVNVMQVGDSVQLHNLPMQIKVKLRKDDSGQYEDQNEISQWKSIHEQVGAQPAAPMQSAPPQVQQAPAGWQAPPPANAAPAQPWQQPQPPQTQQPWQAPPAQGAYQQPQQPQMPPPNGAPPAPWTPPAGGQPWQQTPPANAGAQQPPATPAQPPHPAQNAVPPWQQPR